MGKENLWQKFWNNGNKTERGTVKTRNIKRRNFVRLGVVAAVGAALEPIINIRDSLLAYETNEEITRHIGEFKDSIDTAEPNVVYQARLERGIHVDLVAVPIGDFEMGHTKEETDELIRASGVTTYDVEEVDPKFRKVKIERAFAIGKFEVTNEQYAQFDSTHHYPPGREKFPVTNLKLAQMEGFCEWVEKAHLGFKVRLPTEREWEYAAKGKTKNLYTWKYSNPPEDMANINSSGLLPVGSMSESRSSCGADDMIGNAAEAVIAEKFRYVHAWSWDIVARGGSYNSVPYSCRTTVRHILLNAQGADIGFRIVMI